jgi:hypothetical protein
VIGFISQWLIYVMGQIQTVVKLPIID